MPHKAEVVPDTKLDNLPWLAHCSCDTEGRFRTESEAYQWINRHLAEYGEVLIHRILEFRDVTVDVSAEVPVSAERAREVVAEEKAEHRHDVEHRHGRDRR